MIEGLTSLQSIWTDALAGIELSGPGPEFVARLEDGLDGPLGQMLETHANFSVRISLRLLLLEKELPFADRLLAAMNRNRERIVAELLRTDTDPSLIPAEAGLWLAAATTMQMAAAPDRKLLALTARSVAERLESLGKRKNMHAAALSRLQVAAYAALLSGDLEMLRRVLAVRKTIAIIPKQWTLLQRIARTATADDVNGVVVLRCSDTDTRAEFMAMFQAHRYPFARQASEYFAEEPWLGGTLLGSYVCAWIYLQTFAPQPTLQSDWPTLRELLIG